MDSTPFIEKWPRTEERDRLLLGLGGSNWKAALGALYLTTGRFVPNEAKRAPGASFGYCNAAGEYKPSTSPDATHVGWTLDAAPGVTNG